MFPPKGKRTLQVKICVSTSGKHISTIEKKICCKQLFVFTLVGNMLSLLGKLIFTDTNKRFH